MDKIVTPDCPQCHGEGSVPFDRDRPEGFSRRPCGQCLRRFDRANPTPSPRFMATDQTMAEFVKTLRQSAADLRCFYSLAATDEDIREVMITGTEKMLRDSADFITSHDPSTKVRMTEAEAPYCNRCEFDHIPGACDE